jgi:hypothetical protein
MSWSNCAGFAWLGPTPELDAATFDELFDANVRAPYFLVAACAPQMAARGGGSIVNIGSMAGQFAMVAGAAYSGTKGALVSMTRSWAAEYSPAGVRVNAIAAGPVYTHIQPDEQTEAIGAGTIMARAAEPGEIAAFLAFLEASTTAGYAGLLGWLGGFGAVCLVGIEGTGSYGAGLARHVSAAGVRVVEVDRSDRQDRRRQGKSDPLDAVSAARAAQSGRARGAPKGRDGSVEIRALMVAKRSASADRIQAINQARSLIVTGPDDIRVRFARHTPAALVAGLASLRPRPGSTVGYATRASLRELGRRGQFLDGQLERLDELIVPLVTARAPGLLAL